MTAASSDKNGIAMTLDEYEKHICMGCERCEWVQINHPEWLRSATETLIKRLDEALSFGTTGRDALPNLLKDCKEALSLRSSERITTTEPEPGRIPELHGVERHARYWTDAAKGCADREEALMALHQAVLGWKNAAYAAHDKLRAISATVAPSEWNLVPNEPTPEMIDAVDKRPEQRHLVRANWKAMIAVAPSFSSSAIATTGEKP